MPRDLSAGAAFGPAQRRTLQDLSRRIDELPRGVLVKGTTPADIITLATSPTLTTIGSPIQHQTVRGREYKLTFHPRAVQAAAGSNFWVSLQVDGALQPLADHWGEGERAYGGYISVWRFKGDGEGHTWTAVGTVSTGSVVLHLQDADYEAVWELEDMGVTP